MHRSWMLASVCTVAMVAGTAQGAGLTAGADSWSGLTAAQAAEAQAGPSIEIEVDTTGARDLHDWGMRAGKLAEKWWPVLCERMGVDEAELPKKARIVFTDPRNMRLKVPAYANRNRITVNADWVRNRPDDWGMIIHELVHVVQRYPNQPDNVGWIVEGMADYLRFWVYEPDAPLEPINAEKATYHDAYRTTGAYFEWIVRNHDADLIKKLDGQLRAGECSNDSFAELLGADPEELWKQFLESGTSKRRADLRAPGAAEIPTLTVEADTTAVPELAEWGEKAAALAEQWWPRLCMELGLERLHAPEHLTIEFRGNLRVPAYASGDRITVSGAWVSSHPDDWGMIVHELSHIAQQYPRQRANVGWLVEGISDYLRFWKYEVDAPLAPINRERAKYTDAYRTTGAFLHWLVENHDPLIVRKCNSLLRRGEMEEGTFRELLGEDPEVLWAEFLESDIAKGRAARRR